MYKVNDPHMPEFVDYINTADFENGSGDISPEGLAFISSDAQRDGHNLLVVGHEISGTVAVFTVGDAVGFGENTIDNPTELNLYPNPTKGNLVQMNKTSDISIYAINGQLVQQLTNVRQFDVSTYETGLYIVRDTEGNVQKLMVTN
jgi:hypothetical protein